MKLEHVRPVHPSSSREGSFASLMRSADHRGCQIALLGLPDDTGVRLNNGVPGAAEGPSAFRSALRRYGTAYPSDWIWPRVYDAGDIQPAPDLIETHDRVTHAVASLLDVGLFPVAIGGGHDLTFPFVRAIASRLSTMRGIYLDAHLDVRTEEGSGMPFRRLLETTCVAGLDVIGLDHAVNSAQHVDWFREHQGRIDQLTPTGTWPADDLFFSIDLDALDAAHAPGVSARNPCGLSSAQASEWAFQAGKNSRVRCFDIMELSPPNDEHGRTARLAAHLFLSFLRGFAERGDAS